MKTNLEELENPNDILPPIDELVELGAYELACRLYKLWRQETLRRNEERRNERNF